MSTSKWHSPWPLGLLPLSLSRSVSLVVQDWSVPCAGRLAKAMFLKFSTSLLAILAATVCSLESLVAKRVPEEEKRIVTRATITKRAIKISIRENPRLAFSPSTLLRVNLRIAYRLGIKYIVAGAGLIARAFAHPGSKVQRQ